MIYELHDFLSEIVPPDERVNVHGPHLCVSDKCVDLFFNPDFIHISHCIVRKIRHNIDCLEIWIE